MMMVILVMIMYDIFSDGDDIVPDCLFIKDGTGSKLQLVLLDVNSF